MTRFHTSLARATVLAFGLAMLLPGCKKKPNHVAKSGGTPTAMDAMDAMDRPATPRPDEPTSAVKDEDLEPL